MLAPKEKSNLQLCKFYSHEYNYITLLTLNNNIKLPVIKTPNSVL